MKTKNFEGTAIYLFVASMAASAFNYLFQIISGRFLSQSDYGILNSAFSLINIFTIFGVALGLSIAKEIAESGVLADKISRLFKLCAMASTVLFAIITGLMHFMGFSYSVSVTSALATCFISLAYIYYGMFQGKKCFGVISIYNLIQPFIKLCLGTTLIFLGIGVNSATFSMIVGGIICIIVGQVWYKKNTSNEDSSDKGKIAPILKYTAFTFISTICLTVFNNIDILIVRKFFSEYDVGIYSCAALFGKILMYIPSALTVLLVPLAAENKKDSTKALNKSLLYSLLLSGTAGMALFILRKFIISLIMGNEYLTAEKYIFPICVMIIPLILVTVLVNYLIATGDKMFVSCAGLVSLICITLSITSVHNSVSYILYTLAVVYLVLFVVLFIRSKRVWQKKI